MTAEPVSATALLGFAAAPTFIVMALLTAAAGGPPDMLCAPAPATMPLSGMAAMYALMAVFHSAPWLRRLGAAQTRAPLTPKGEPQ
jgi:hypothetical protein